MSDAPHHSECVCAICKSRTLRVGRMVRLTGSRYWPDAVVPVVGVKRDGAWVTSVDVEVDGRKVRFGLRDVTIAAQRQSVEPSRKTGESK